MKLLLLAFFLAACTANATTPTAYTPLPPTMFTAVPGSAGTGGEEVSPCQASFGQCSGPQPGLVDQGRASTPPSGPKPTPRPVVSRLIPPTVSVRGVATWQPLSGYWASAGPALRALGVRVGQSVRVCSGGRCVAVRIWPGGCWCPDRRGVPVLLDLSRLAFSRLADPGRGVLAVEVTW